MTPDPEYREPSAASELTWSGDLRHSLEDAGGSGGLVFVDFTGETCSNCRLNEQNVFTQPEIRDLLKSGQKPMPPAV